MTTYQRGDQIAYVPLHAAGDMTHPDVEFGFVMAPAGPDAYFCRYWRKGKPGELRTVANSEATPADMMIAFDSVPPVRVDEAIGAILSQQVTA